MEYEWKLRVPKRQTPIVIGRPLFPTTRFSENVNLTWHTNVYICIYNGAGRCKFAYRYSNNRPIGTVGSRGYPATAESEREGGRGASTERFANISDRRPVMIRRQRFWIVNHRCRRRLDEIYRRNRPPGPSVDTKLFFYSLRAVSERRAFRWHSDRWKNANSVQHNWSSTNVPRL